MSAAELTNVLEERLVHYETGYDVDEVGKVLSVGDGIARVYGLRTSRGNG